MTRVARFREALVSDSWYRRPMKKTLRFLAVPVFAAALFSLAASGCYRHNYGPAVSPPPGPASYATWNHHILFGIIGVGNHTDPRRVCGGQAAYVQNYFGILGILLGVVTAGIYTPSTTRIWCSGARAESDPGDQRVRRTSAREDTSRVPPSTPVTSSD